MGNKKHPGETPQPWALISPNYWACLSLFWLSGGARRELRRAGINSVPWGDRDCSRAEGKCTPLARPLSAQPSEAERIPAEDLVSNSCSELEHHTSSKAEVMMDLSYWTSVEECYSLPLAVEGQMRACWVVCGLLKSSLHCVTGPCLLLGDAGVGGTCANRHGHGFHSN